ncbi:hypothetical protein KJ910_01265 [Patescibacteria group bacterium]|nr:hypothetical protein [Patescibacteria group bacterium]MBU1907350.1 hypothetical protein [Patescibacteria group bacterium]
MLSDTAYTLFLGLPLVAWGGIATLISVLITATLGAIFHKKHSIPFKWHVTAAVVTIILAFGHALFALSVYLDY